MKSSSIQDVAQLAHVSISTVSRSFTRPDLVSKATRDKVMKAADKLNFSISRSAAALKPAVRCVSRYSSQAGSTYGSAPPSSKV